MIPEDMEHVVFNCRRLTQNLKNEHIKFRMRQQEVQTALASMHSQPCLTTSQYPSIVGIDPLDRNTLHNIAMLTKQEEKANDYHEEQVY